jgi:hypothetical protein
LPGSDSFDDNINERLGICWRNRFTSSDTDGALSFILATVAGRGGGGGICAFVSCGGIRATVDVMGGIATALDVVAAAVLVFVLLFEEDGGGRDKGFLQPMARSAAVGNRTSSTSGRYICLEAGLGGCGELFLLCRDAVNAARAVEIDSKKKNMLSAEPSSC